MSLQILTPPTAEPITVQEVKDRLRLKTSADDSVIQQHITSAREFCERVSRRSLVQKDYLETRDSFPYPGQPIRLQAPPLHSVSSVKYYDSGLTLQEWSSAEYMVAAAQQPGLIFPKPGFTYPSPANIPGAVEILYTAGDTIPQNWKDSITNVAVFIYGHPGEKIPEDLVQIPKIHVF